VKKEDLKGALALLKDMKAAGLKPDEVTYTTLMQLYVKKEDLKGALALLEDMKAAGIKPDEVTYTTLMQLHVKLEDLKGALALLEDMKETGIEPDKVTYNTLMQLHVKLEDLKGALALLEDMKATDIKPDEVTYNIFIDLLIKIDQLDEAKAVFLSHLSMDQLINEQGLNVHGLSHGAAFTALTIFIETYWESDSFILITGKGIHSNLDLYAMRDFLQEKINEKFKHLNCLIGKKNKGIIKISRNPMKQEMPNTEKLSIEEATQEEIREKGDEENQFGKVAADQNAANFPPDVDAISEEEVIADENSADPCTNPCKCIVS
jgi:pentatricopeptide repeat protein